MLDIKRLENNLEILKIHNNTHKPIIHITDGKKYEVELIDEVLTDAGDILNKIKNGNLIEVHCKIGDAVYFVCEDDDDYFISENKVTDVSSKGFFVSCYDPPQDDLGFFELYDVVGKDAFFTKDEAEQRLKEVKNGNGNV